MKVLIQWSTDNPADWTEIDSSEWASLPKRKDPTGTVAEIDKKPGWINRINVQGVKFAADHYAIEELGNGVVRVTAWTDDPAQVTENSHEALVFDFYPLAGDPELGGAINTKQLITRYCGSDFIERVRSRKTRRTTVKVWDAFILPSDAIIRHGVLMSDELYQAHEDIQSLRGWREWTEGLKATDISHETGLVPPQRSIGRWKKAKGTKTYFQSDTEVIGVHTGVVDVSEDVICTIIAAGAATLNGANLGVNDEELIFCFTTPADEPNDADWPDGEYRCQLDVTVIDNGLTYGLINTGSPAVDGHFARVDSGLTTDSESANQDDADFTTAGGTGLKLATANTTWTAGNASDRFECLISCSRDGVGHGGSNITIQVGTSDSFIDGPWVSTAFVPSSGDIVMNELQWPGSPDDTNDEWIELYNNLNEDVDLNGWTLNAEDGQPTIAITGVIPAKRFYLLCRIGQDSAKGVECQQIYTGALQNEGEDIVLRDVFGNIIDAIMFDGANGHGGWPVGNIDDDIGMERISPMLNGSSLNNWGENNNINKQGTGRSNTPLQASPGLTNSRYEKMGRNAPFFSTGL